MKIKNILWISFVIAALLITTYNVYRTYSILYSENEHQHDEHCNHSLDDITVTNVNFAGITPDKNRTFAERNFVSENGQNFESGMRLYELSRDGAYLETDYVYCGEYLYFYLVLHEESNQLPIISLLDTETKAITPLITNNIYVSELNIYRDTIYYRYFTGTEGTLENVGNLLSLNLLTGEKKMYEIEELLGHSHELSYVFVGDTLYLMNKSKTIEIDLKRDEIVLGDT